MSAGNALPGSAPLTRGRLLLFILFAGAFILLAWFISQYPDLSKPVTMNTRYSYFLFAILGVTFHIASKYRELREQSGFDFVKYLPDYLFRYFQACIYVLIITSLWEQSPALMDATPSPNKYDLSFSLTIICLFTGMYISKVEDAFENLGDKFRDMLKGLLGVPLGKLSPTAQKENLVSAMAKYLELHGNAELRKLPGSEPIRAELEKLFSIANEHLVKGEVEAAEQVLTNLDFRIKDLAFRAG